MKKISLKKKIYFSFSFVTKTLENHCKLLRIRNESYLLQAERQSLSTTLTLSELLNHLQPIIIIVLGCGKGKTLNYTTKPFRLVHAYYNNNYIIIIIFKVIITIIHELNGFNVQRHCAFPLIRLI